MCQYQVTSKGLALVVLLEPGGHAPPPPSDFGKTVNPVLTRGSGDYAQHVIHYLPPGFSNLPTALPGAWPGTLV